MTVETLLRMAEVYEKNKCPNKAKEYGDKAERKIAKHEKYAHLRAKPKAEEPKKDGTKPKR